MPDRSGTGDPPADCTCLLVWTYDLTNTGSAFAVKTWRIQMIDPNCPHHGDRVRTEEADDG